MKWLLLLMLVSVLVLYLILGAESTKGEINKKRKDVEADTAVRDVFRSENVAKGFIKDKRAPSPGFMFRRKYKGYRPHGYHGYHGHRYRHRKGREENEEEEEGGFFGR